MVAGLMGEWFHFRRTDMYTESFSDTETQGTDRHSHKSSFSLSLPCLSLKYNQPFGHSYSLILSSKLSCNARGCSGYQSMSASASIKPSQSVIVINVPDSYSPDAADTFAAQNVPPLHKLFE